MTCEELQRQYGIAVKRVTAARMIDVHPTTISHMIADGRLETMAGGKRVSVESIARYLDNPKKADFETHFRKRHQRFYLEA